MRDVEWATSSCTLTFNTLGIWPEGADGTDVNACTRANNTPVLATGDDFGKVKVFSSPASQQKVRMMVVVKQGEKKINKCMFTHTHTLSNFPITTKKHF